MQFQINIPQYSARYLIRATRFWWISVFQRLKHFFDCSIAWIEYNWSSCAFKVLVYCLQISPQKHGGKNSDAIDLPLLHELRFNTTKVDVKQLFCFHNLIHNYPYLSPVRLILPTYVFPNLFFSFYRDLLFITLPTYAIRGYFMFKFIFLWVNRETYIKGYKTKILNQSVQSDSVETKNECCTIQANRSRETTMQEGRICSSEIFE